MYSHFPHATNLVSLAMNLIAVINTLREVTRRLPGANVVNTLGYPDVAPAMQNTYVIVGLSGFTESPDCEVGGELHTFIAEFMSLGACHNAKTLAYSDHCIPQSRMLLNSSRHNSCMLNGVFLMWTMPWILLLISWLSLLAVVRNPLRYRLWAFH